MTSLITSDAERWSVPTPAITANVALTQDNCTGNFPESLRRQELPPMAIPNRIDEKALASARPALPWAATMKPSHRRGLLNRGQRPHRWISPFLFEQLHRTRRSANLTLRRVHQRIFYPSSKARRLRWGGRPRSQSTCNGTSDSQHRNGSNPLILSLPCWHSAHDLSIYHSSTPCVHDADCCAFHWK